jgi:hypothetical protein
MDMDMSSFFQARQAKDLEDLFFLKQDKKLIEGLHKIEKMKETKKALAEVSGITDDEVLQKFVELNVRPEILASLALIPLIEVAWADGNIDLEEEKAVLAAAAESFISKDSPDFDLLKSWMKHKPDPKLLDAWIVYITGLCKKLSAHQTSALKKDFLGHATDVAKAAGGFLGLGNKVSKAEQAVLDKLASAFK